jgi:ribosomal protein L37AE/L43A
MSETRMVPYHCPYCGDQDLHPDAAESRAWRCRSCLRVFVVTFVGVAS